MQQQLPKLKKRKLKDLRRLITFKLTQQKTKSYRRIRNCTRPDWSRCKCRLWCYNWRKEAFTNALEDILSKATEDISDQTTNAEIATVKNSALEQLKAQRINPEVKKNALEAIREVVNKQIEIIKMQMHRRKKLHVRI